MVHKLSEHNGNILPLKLEHSVEKLMRTKLEVTMQPKKRANPNFRHMNKPFQINPCAVLQSCLINTVYQCYKNKWERGGGLEREGELNNLLPLKRRGWGCLLGELC